MGFNCGIVGLPNVGKSTLFNALTATANAQAANYPFCTIEPNTGIVGVKDERLDKLAALAGSQKIIPNQLEFVDIAGLVRGASKGEGLGNQFLGHIRAVDAVIHVVRCFEDDDITHVDDSIDPIRDIETIETELLLSDMESLERRVTSLAKKAKGNDKEAKATMDVVNKVLPKLQEGIMARAILIDKDDIETFKNLDLLTSKPILYICNVSEDDAASGNENCEKVSAYAKAQGAEIVIISAAIESEVAQLSTDEEKIEFLESIGLKKTGLEQVVFQGYKLLNLLTFFTIGPKEARAWTVRSGSKAPQAAGVIHTDFERGYICAETTAYNDYIACGGESQAKSEGKLRIEGKDYLVKDGDIFHFRFNV